MAVPEARRSRWGAALRTTWFKATAAVVAAAALGTGAFLAGGYNTAQTKVDDSSVWALQSNGERYARVNTALGQLDTVKSAASPSDLVQNSGHVLLYSQSDTRVASVDLAQPASYAANSANFKGTPAGTTSVVSTGDYIAYRSDTGEVRATTIADGANASGLKPIAAPGGGQRSYSADSVAIGTDGILYAYSHTAKTVLRFDIKTGRTLGTDAVRDGPTSPNVSMTVVGDTWVLLSGDGRSLWFRGRSAAVSTNLDDRSKLQQPSGKQSVVVAASSSRLLAVNLTSGAQTVLSDGESASVPAAPAWNGSRLYAAWLVSGAGPGRMWAGHATIGGAPVGSAKQLSYGGATHTLSASVTPVFRSSGTAEILNDATSGWVWSVPQGTIVQGSQTWQLNQTVNTTTDQSETTQTRESDPTPPVAVNDSFGVRAGALVTLPVMDNDYDANGDVISIVPGSVKGLNPAFGTASIANAGQSITVQVQPNAPPTATFVYQVTDGTASGGGLKSGDATVSLAVHGAAQNGAPLWCNGASPCLFSWPDNSQVAPGSSVEVPVLRGWVDPDGDAMFATAPPSSSSDDYTVSVSPDGTLVFQAAPNAKPRTVTIDITVSDVRGATTVKPLHIVIQNNPTLTVENFGLMTAQNVPLTVDPSSHIRGSKGTPQIVSATLAASSSANVTIDSSGATFVFSAGQVGSYPVTMTVMDPASKTTATATVRITVVSSSQPLLSTAPVTVFVRPQTDTSVDVFSAVQNPTGRVLLLSSPQPHPAPGASLDVDVVGASQLRVRGTTATNGQGLLGTVDYLVSDGTSDANMRVEGTATVYLLSSKSLPGRPVAINDSVTVRAGAQVDIPVLQNDVGQEGDLVELDPSSVQNPSGQGLAFASGQVLRYLAPTVAPAKPITLYYSAYSAGDPTEESRASVTVTILKQGGDRPPRPVTLTGRVTAGSSVTIPFNPYGVDPDGDDVTLDRIMSQPQQGSAQISADGTSIIFTALAGSEGQQSFTYRVRDSEGETGIGTVMVGVLNAQTDPAPVTFSDYVQVQAGAHNQVVVHPTANDVDPSGGTLKLGAVTPDTPTGSSLYTVLASSIASHNSDQVIIKATPNPRTLTYTYSVSNANGDVSAGLIVVDVVSGAVPDYPIASDTIVEAQNRGQLATGIDVVSGKVSWGAGDVSGLTLSLPPQAPPGVSVSGTSIKVPKVPASGLIVPFELKGPDFNGKVEQTYGFLRVPALANVILALKSTAQPIQVREGGSATVNLDDYISVPAGQTLLTQNGSAPTTGARRDARCTVAGTRLTYDAGTGAPWTDACMVSVRLGGQQESTVVAIPVQVIPKQPQPQLRPASLTASPGQPAVTFDLTQMVTWLGRQNDAAGLRYLVSYTGKLFRVTQSGDSVSVTAADAAQPGLQEQAHVQIAGYPSAGTATITLKVGPASSQQPAGGSTSLVCSEANGTSCSTTVIGLSDEVNAFKTPLQLVDVTPSAPGCIGVTFTRSGSSAVRATWSSNAPGGACTTTFDVRDAQGRQNAAGAGSGKLSFQLKGYPVAPASVAQVAYTGNSVTLAVTPGNSGSAYPAVTGYQIYLDGKKSVTCGIDGACPPVTGLSNGAKHTFQAFAVNAVGQSKSGPSTTGWAFAQPVISGVTTTPVYDANITSAGTGAFDLTIPNSDSSASGYRVDWGGNSQSVQATSGKSVVVRLYAPAATPTTVTVTPISQFSPPPGDQIGAQPVSSTVTTAGSPSLSASNLGFPTTDSSITITGSVAGGSNGSTKSGSYLFVASTTNAPDCGNSGGSSLSYSSPSDGAVSTSTTISGLKQFETYTVYACYTNQYGVVQKVLNSAVTVWDQSNAPTPSGCSYDITSQGTGLPDYEYNGSPSCSSGAQKGPYALNISGNTDVWGAPPALTAQYCYPGSQYCGQTQQSFSNPDAPYQMRVTSVAPVCSADMLTMNITGGDGYSNAGAVITPTEYTYTNAVGFPMRRGDPSQPIPPGATNIVVTRFTITFSGSPSFANYDSGAVTYPVDSSNCGIPASGPTQPGAAGGGN
ncbi:Ig-like domain-containing protein [Gryllotalpicola reticulitermitis]|uniref:Ig-like domain-containing protein n=1 Tax=Gryllotalpicola reticulitermitis TaxID=1184153 RepID=A0ABV8Q3U1_9MICO